MNKIPDRNNLIGKVFGRLTVIEYSHSKKGSGRYWVCKCNCGKIKTFYSGNLKSNHTKSCGCISVSHEETNSTEYYSWAAMVQRCDNKNTKSYKDIGNIGITVCDRWYKFENFLSDMGKKPHSDYELLRITKYGNYEPSNCKWIPHSYIMEECNNSKFWTIEGNIYRSLKKAAVDYGVSRQTIKAWCEGYTVRTKSKEYNYPPKDGCWSELKYPNKDDYYD